MRDSTGLRTLPVPIVDAQLGDEIDHYVTCHDDDQTLCGLDATDIPWAPIESPCVVCTDLLSMPCGCDCGCCAEIVDG